MSIILDALRKADAERERSRGGAASLEALTRTLPAVPVHREGPAGAMQVGLALLAAAVLAGGAWWWGRQSAPPVSPAAEPAPVAAAEPAPVAAASAPSTMPAPRPSPPASGVIAPAVAPAPSAQSLGPAVHPAAPAASQTLRGATRPIQPPSGARGDETPVVRRPAESALRLDQLTAEQRAGLPPLQIGGYMYSEPVQSRVLVLDGQVRSQGDTLRPGLVLELIGPRSARLRWHEQLIELVY